MMVPVKTISTFLFLLLASSVGVDAADHLRRSTNKQQHKRELQLTSTILNTLIQGFGPVLEGMLQATLAEKFDPIYLGNETTVELGSVDLIPSSLPTELTLGPLEIPLPIDRSCQASASATYGLGTITGLSSVDINSFELVPGSESIELPRFGLGGAKWSGTWLLNATFSNVSAETSASIKMETCIGKPIEQALIGTTALGDPNMEISLTLGGETSNLFRPLQSSQITTSQMEGLDFQLGTVDVEVGTVGPIIPAFELSNTFNAFLLNEFSDGLEPLMMDALNGAMKEALPIGL